MAHRAPESKRFVQVPEQFRMFDSSDFASIVPDAPPKPKKPFPKRKWCSECGALLDVFQKGKCGDCGGKRPATPEQLAKMCCGECPEGECRAIPF